jgi:hypothetical protein
MLEAVDLSGNQLNSASRDMYMVELRDRGVSVNW